MTTWTSISNAAVAVGGIPASTTVTALRDNPSALAEASTGAPVVFAGWHPVDKVSVGDGKTGLIYDSAVNGTQANVVTPDFVDGYEYRIVALDLEHNNLTETRLRIEAFKQTEALYRLIRETSQGLSGASFSYHAEFHMPRISSDVHFVMTMSSVGNTFSSQIDMASGMFDEPPQKILRARVSFNSGSITAGKIYFFRRREYASSP
jgi:hypothetical protein